MRHEKTKMIMETRATFLSLPSRDFLLPYSPAPDIPPIPNPIPPLGDINKTEPINTIPDRIIRIINKVRMSVYKKINLRSITIKNSLGNARGMENRHPGVKDEVCSRDPAGIYIEKYGFRLHAFGM
jgi:hypothetical protein